MHETNALLQPTFFLMKMWSAESVEVQNAHNNFAKVTSIAYLTSYSNYFVFYSPKYFVGINNLEAPFVSTLCLIRVPQIIILCAR